MKLDAIFECPKCESTFIVEDRYDFDNRFFGGKFMEEYVMSWKGGRVYESCRTCKSSVSMNCRAFPNGVLWVNDEDEEKCGR